MGCDYEKLMQDSDKKLTDDDQDRVDRFLKTGVNSVSRRPFKPFLLIALLLGVVTGLSLLSQWLAHKAGVY